MSTVQVPLKPLRVGVVGAGYFSEFQLQAWRQIPGVELVAVCDVDECKARAAAERHQVPKVYTDMAAMLQDAALGLVDIATPPAAHQALVKTAADFGVAAICQKPFGLNLSQAKAMVDMAQAAGITLVIHENFRFMPWYRSMRQMLDDGVLGHLHGISFRLRPGDGQGPQAYLDRQPYFQQMPRLLVVETAIHFIDTFRYLMGEVEAVYARLSKRNAVIKGEDGALITFEFANRAMGVFDGNRLNDTTADNPRRTMGEMWVDGEKGSLRLDGDGRLWFKPLHAPEVACDNDRGDLAAYGGGACQALQAHVVKALATGALPENTGRDYLKNLQIQEAVYASHAQGRRIELKDFVPAAEPLIPSL